MTSRQACGDYRAPEEALRERVMRREEQDQDASDAGLEVLERQLKAADPLTAEEPVIAIEHDRPVPLEAVSRVLHRTLRQRRSRIRDFRGRL